MSDEKFHIDYGFSVVRHESVVRIELEPLTWRMVFYRVLGALIVLGLCAVIGASVAVLLR